MEEYTCELPMLQLLDTVNTSFTCRRGKGSFLLKFYFIRIRKWYAQLALPSSLIALVQIRDNHKYLYSAQHKLWGRFFDLTDLDITPSEQINSVSIHKFDCWRALSASVRDGTTNIHQSQTPLTFYTVFPIRQSRPKANLDQLLDDSSPACPNTYSSN